jgi:exosome complex RNA-binding protein Rrp4
MELTHHRVLSLSNHFTQSSQKYIADKTISDGDYTYAEIVDFDASRKVNDSCDDLKNR